jgi:hypothetical protein
MATKKNLAIKFGAVNKSKLVGARVGHTRTGACTAKGKCYHGRINRGR